MFRSLLVLALFSAPLQAGEKLVLVDVFTAGTDGYHTYRIPALAVTRAGTLLAFCEGRKTSREDLGDNDLMLKRSTDGGRNWSKLQLVYEEGGDKKVTIGNPTTVVDRETGTVFVFLQRNGRDALVVASRDDGKTWSSARDITSQVKRKQWKFYCVGPGAAIQLRHGSRKGRIIVPAYHRLTDDKSGASRAHVFYSDDHGKTFRIGGLSGLHTNECQVVETLENGRPGLLLNARNHWARSGGKPRLAGKRIIARSNDAGIHWLAPQFDGALIEPTCQASLFRHGFPSTTGRGRILFANPAAGSRSRATVRLSYDEGRTWPVSRQIYAGSSAYTAIEVLPNGDVVVLFERDSYGRLTLARFSLEWLQQ
ncbi:MAG: glycosyl hydrolase [Planctomycetaceae bacterium]|jgi:sialidase-1|nr:glycosyl hydrolase [Planctomycetaceae bacterium]